MLACDVVPGQRCRLLASICDDEQYATSQQQQQLSDALEVARAFCLEWIEWLAGKKLLHYPGVLIVSSKAATANKLSMTGVIWL